jgi:fluoride exporter
MGGMNVTSLTVTGLVGLAGALGALARYTVGRFVSERIKSTFPWGTLIINVSGAFVIGFIAGLVSAKVLNTTFQAVLATGFLGGYTTFSTMSWEAIQLFRGGRVQGVLYLAGNFAPGLLAAALGLVLGGLC